ncbi:MAG: hypothetical protein JSR80_03465 [Verrucomicrobia bacterium]|nr:hypothetical protein [Verrucomicrobiota bacterium]
MQASKWLAHQVLLDGEEMKDLLASVGNFEVYPVGRILQEGEPFSFVEEYCRYVEKLKQGAETEVPAILCVALSCSSEAVQRVEVAPGKMLWRSQLPVVQVQPHSLSYSPLNDTFYPLVRGKETISWGVQFSYPQLFQKGKEIEKVDERFPNTALYKALTRWIRHHTVATPFVVNGMKRRVPIRIGKKCLGWIHCHAQLKKQGLSVDPN